MANTNAPFGFVPTSNYSGAAPNYQQVTRLANYNASAIYSGDPVTSQTDGTIAIASAGATQIAGIFVGCSYLSVSQARVVWNNYWPGSDVASTNFVECYVINDPNALFLCQTGTASPVAQININENINFAIGTPTPANGRSGAYANQATLNPATTTLPFRVVSLVTDPPGANGSDATTAFNRIIVAFNNVDARTLTGI